MSIPVLPASTFDFVRELKNNNNREWFALHKEVYQHELGFVESFADALLQELNIHDVIETPNGKKSLRRIYKDTRFSKDKIPFKTCWSGGFRRAGKYRRGGYYFRFEPGNSLIVGGFRGPNPADLKLIRDDIAFDAAPLQNILNSKTFIDTFGTLQGEQLKTTPKGYDANNDGIELLRYKQFLLIRRFTDEEVLHENFIKEASITFRNMRPFFDYMSEVLATDINGQ
ncbi:TIGR02453 family protein [Mucilaginibacter mallensis]|uniref:TIGR02453 family protein n=1 Tax=Mucilaginibacter mallensis TaxID=652787 RepID=A0A1H1U4D9_MUCMA|nr:DUF2461 domain-containing protein [Mucilaginibacter mallensis]SDS67405.1 TIGR02453 family protein [Mucilaginibacter mallensis]